MILQVKYITSNQALLIPFSLIYHLFLQELNTVFSLTCVLQLEIQQSVRRDWYDNALLVTTVQLSLQH